MVGGMRGTAPGIEGALGFLYVAISRADSPDLYLQMFPGTWKESEGGRRGLRGGQSRETGLKVY